MYWNEIFIRNSEHLTYCLVEKNYQCSAGKVCFKNETYVLYFMLLSSVPKHKAKYRLLLCYLRDVQVNAHTEGADPANISFPQVLAGFRANLISEFCSKIC